MSSLAIIHLVTGFLSVFISACAGIFLATDLTEAFAQDISLIGTWNTTLLISAHSHTNQFGILHVLFGLSEHWNVLPKFVRRFQLIGLCLGSIAMSILMALKSFQSPSVNWDLIGAASGFCLSMALISIGLHTFGIALRLTRYRPQAS